MRVLQVSGLVLVAVGLWFIIRPPSYSRQQTVFKFGEVEARMQQQHPLPGWVGGMALGAGLVMVVVGLRKG